MFSTGGSICEIPCFLRALLVSGCAFSYAPKADGFVSRCATGLCLKCQVSKQKPQGHSPKKLFQGSLRPRPPSGLFPFFYSPSPRFLVKLPNTKKGALFIPRLLGILAPPPPRSRDARQLVNSAWTFATLQIQSQPQAQSIALPLEF